MAHEKIVTAFNQEQQAQVAKEKLITEGIAEKNIDIISGERLRVEDKEIRHPSFWQRIFGTDVDENYASEYNRALQTGGVLLTVRVSQEEAGNVEMLLDQYSNDYSSFGSNTGQGTDREFLGETDDRLARGPGGSYATDKNDPLTTTSGGSYMADTDDRLATDADSRLGTETDDRFATDEPLYDEGADRPLTNEAEPLLPVTTGSVQRDDRPEGLKLAEEQVEIGKRQVSDGVVRLRRYTVEESVAEDVSLYDQHAEVFRHAVDEPTYLNDVDWSDKTIEVEESHEVPVVSKSAHIREEVGVRSEGTERVETVKDSVRRQEVKIEKEGDSSTERDLTHLDDHK